jgi:hypothetical protein
LEASESQSGEGAGAEGVDEAELQRRLEEQLRKVRVQDLLLESVASILNLSARRIAKEDERDLEQGRVGIEAVRSILELLEPGPREQVREALSQVQMLYAREAQGGGEESEGEGESGGGEAEPGTGGGETPKVERPSGLWTPPGT